MFSFQDKLIDIARKLTADKQNQLTASISKMEVLSAHLVAFLPFQIRRKPTQTKTHGAVILQPRATLVFWRDSSACQVTWHYVIWFTWTWGYWEKSSDDK